MAETVYDEVRAERARAHAKHGDTSMEAFDADDPERLAILMEEVGEVAKEFNEARHDQRLVDLTALRKELIQTAAMATAWAEAAGEAMVNNPHRYTVDVILHGAEPYPCVICGRPRQATLHELAEAMDGSDG